MFQTFSGSEPRPRTVTARIHDFLGPPAEERTRVPSLLELVLRKCYNSPQLSRLPLLLPEDVGVAYLIRLLKQTFWIKEAGGRQCSVCGREYIVPRTEWDSGSCSEGLSQDTIPNVHNNITMAPRKEGKLACEHKSSDLPTGQPASYRLLGRAYYAHRCKSCTAEDCRRSVDEMHSNYHAERLRLLRAIQKGKTLLDRVERRDGNLEV